MNKRQTLVVLVSAILLTVLFHRQYLGLNLLIAQWGIFIFTLLQRQFKFRGLYPISIGIGFLASSLFTVITHSVFVYIMNFVLFFLFIGISIYPQSKSIIYTLGNALSNLFYAQVLFFCELSTAKLKGKKLSTYIRKWSIFIIPIFIIIIFLSIYRNSNPIFDGIIGDSLSFISEQWLAIFQNFDGTIIFTFILTLIISAFVLYKKVNPYISSLEEHSNENHIRIRKKKNRKFRLTALKNEYKSGIFMLITLNLLLLLLNITDIKWVWFGFEWEGQYLKQFVHEGTYLLIFSILISIVLVLFYFRGNLNFYKKNSLLKTLSYIWIAQNAFLSISVGIRNFWYIDYFALAYKRIGVIIFLLLTLYGLYTVFIKVKKTKSSFYLFKTNSFALILILSISSFINWDNYIAQYNFKHSQDSFLHLNYMSELSNKSLPYLDHQLEELQQINFQQNKKFDFAEEYMTPQEYHNIIERRKTEFNIRWESKSLMEWNLAEYLAYKRLNSDNLHQ